MLEIVQNSMTISDVQINYGGGAMGALKNDPLDKYIHDKNQDQKQYVCVSVSDVRRDKICIMFFPFVLVVFFSFNICFVFSLSRLSIYPSLCPSLSLYVFLSLLL